MEASPIPVLCVTDEKPGHTAQTAGLIAALARRAPVDVRHQTPISMLSALRDLATGATPEGYLGQTADRPDRDPSPTLVICCGHATHLTGLALRRALGARVVVLMRPSLPLGWFDLVVAPQHDGAAPSDRLILTSGVLNPLTAEGPHHPDHGLVLVGGPSRHHGWDEAGLLGQLRAVVAATPGTRWTVTTSRRTPDSTARALLSCGLPGVEVVPRERTAAGWVAQHLADASVAWITEDSVSMVYEALTAGVAVGLLAVPPLGSSRVTRGVDALVAEGRVVRWPDWQPGSALPRHAPLAEADRVAGEILRRWYPAHLLADRQA